MGVAYVVHMMETIDRHISYIYTEYISVVKGSWSRANEENVANVCIRFYLNASYVARYVSEAHNSQALLESKSRSLSRSPSYVIGLTQHAYFIP